MPVKEHTVCVFFKPGKDELSWNEKKYMKELSEMAYNIENRLKRSYDKGSKGGKK